MRHQLRIAACLGLMFFSQALLALGLGNAEVRSYLNQPLEARIQLLNAATEELESVTAGLANAADFERLGLTRTVSVPLHFRVNTEPDQAYVEVTSRLPVSDPVVQLVLEVRWTGGRMLREYTLFLDPPTVAARAPAPMVSERRPAEAPVRPEPDYPDPDEADFVETVKTPVAPTRPEPVPDQSGTEMSHVETEPEISVEVQPVTPASQAEAPAPVEVEQPASPAVAVAPAALVPGAGQEYGPVQRGDTLWGIASNYARGTSYTVNQAMLAIQRMNPDAFGGNNINVLHRGAILRMPPLHELDRLGENEASAEAIRQEQAYRDTRSGTPYEAAPPVIADAALAPISGESRPTSAPASIAAAEEARLELVPPAAGSDAPGGGGADEQATGGLSSEELEEVLARTEEELANAQQENTYLNNRIQELEQQIAAASGEGLVADSAMAGLESGLRENRLDPGEPAQPTAGSDDTAWYQGAAGWLAGLLVLAVGVAVWLLRRTGASQRKPEAGAAVGNEVELRAAQARGMTEEL